jgi:CHAD domain-containing protein
MTGELQNAEKALRDLRKSLKSLSRDPRPEQVHKLRTSARRVEAIVAAFPPRSGKNSRRLVKSIEPLRKAAGDVRDMDVLASSLRRLSREIPSGSVAKLVDHFHDARAEEAGELYRAFRRKRKEGRKRLREYGDEIESVFALGNTSSNGHGQNGRRGNGINPTAKQLMRDLAEWPKLGPRNIHRFRLKVKQLRYILQLGRQVKPDFLDSLGKCQRRIGEWHDWEQLAHQASKVLDPKQDHALLARINQIAQQKLEAALAEGNSLRRHHPPSSAPHILGC